MSATRRDGGPAFPLTSDAADAGMTLKETQGMTLRDYFAALAMHAELNTAGAHEEPARCLVEEAEKNGRSIEQQIAFNAYALADAMLAERSRGE